MNAISTKRDLIFTDKKNFTLNLANYQSAKDIASEKLKKERIVHRVWEHNHTVWKREPTEITSRLDWLHSSEVMMDAGEDIQKFTDEVTSAGFTHSLLLGIGGSSLAPEVFRHIFGVRRREG